jgi:hypothetical protein
LNETISKFELGAAEASATEACELAPLSCLERVDVDLGPHGEFFYPPGPVVP